MQATAHVEGTQTGFLAFVKFDGKIFMRKSVRTIGQRNAIKAAENGYKEVKQFFALFGLE